MALPSGLVTFVFTDIEGSTRLAHVLGAGYRAVLHQHRTLLRGVLRLHHGVEVSSCGDSSLTAFPDARAALQACRAAQRTLEAEKWPGPQARPRIRIGIHSGNAKPSGGEYASPEVHRAARIVAAAHGGQVLCSAGTARAAAPLPDPLALWDLGLYRLRGFDDRERLFQLVAPGWERWFPRPRTAPAPPHNLPVAATSFVGRRAEQAGLAELLARHRLVTLTGPGGVGKTRLAVQVAAGLAGGYRDGVWFVDLTSGGPAGLPLGLATAAPGGPAGRDRWRRPPAGSGAGPGRVGTRAAGDGPAGEALAGRVLLVLDGCHAHPELVPPAVSRLLAADPSVRVLATGRRPLGVPAEVGWRLPPLSLRPAPDGGPGEAAVLLADRVAAARGGNPVPAAELPDLTRIAARLHGLPLAIEQAAGQLRALAAAQLAARLDASSAARAGIFTRSVGRERGDGSHQCPAPSRAIWEGEPTCTRATTS
jgi:class 3 adenylate cyclase